MNVSLIREPDDLIAGVRISLGSPRESDDFYLVFRGDPKKVVELLDKALVVTKKDLLAGKYEDRRRLN